MTLAVILFVSFLYPLSAAPVSLAQPTSTQTAADQSSTAQSPAASTAQTPAPAPEQPPAETGEKAAPAAPAQSPAPAKTSSAPNKATTTAKRTHHARKKAASLDCDSSAPATTKSAAGSPAQGTATAHLTPPSASTATAPSNCPPIKVIVRQGGTTDPSIELAGGSAGDQASRARNSARQMLAAAEHNLKTIAARGLTANQQAQVSQIQQFVRESKTASAAGDLDRARTLAWKAQTLSEELVKPSQ
ncbi:MAG TPA: hypothetical protein VMG31_00630 [Verrucomicrobiae bacterium]|nr:hypothetical protein [Verrucomicrobiae bacterium]